MQYVGRNSWILPRKRLLSHHLVGKRPQGAAQTLCWCESANGKWPTRARREPQSPKHCENPRDQPIKGARGRTNARFGPAGIRCAPGPRPPRRTTWMRPRLHEGRAVRNTGISRRNIARGIARALNEAECQWICPGSNAAYNAPPNAWRFIVGRTHTLADSLGIRSASQQYLHATCGATHSGECAGQCIIEPRAYPWGLARTCSTHRPPLARHTHRRRAKLASTEAGSNTGVGA